MPRVRSRVRSRFVTASLREQGSCGSGARKHVRRLREAAVDLIMPLPSAGASNSARNSSVKCRTETEQQSQRSSDS